MMNAIGLTQVALIPRQLSRGIVDLFPNYVDVLAGSIRNPCKFMLQRLNTICGCINNSIEAMAYSPYRLASCWSLAASWATFFLT